MADTLFDPPTAAPGDYHAHVFQAGVAATEHPRYVPDYAASPDAYLKQLDAHGLAWGTLIQPSFLGMDNSYLLAALQQYPQRLRGVIVINDVNPSATFNALGGFVKDGFVALHEAGVRGVRLNLIGRQMPDLAGLAWAPILRFMESLDWHLEFQAKADQQIEIADLLPKLPEDLKIVIDHYGLPQTSLEVELGEHPLFDLVEEAGERLWVKASGPYRCGPGAARAMHDELEFRGFTRFVPGSDWPHTRFEEKCDGAWDGFGR